MDELLPCPYCGGTEIRIHTDDIWKAAYCIECGAEGQYDLGESGARENWNNRPLESALRARVAELEKQLEKWEEFSPNFPPGYCENP